MIRSSGTRLSLSCIIGGCLSAISYFWLRLNSQSVGQADLVLLLSVICFCAGISFYLWWQAYKTNTNYSIWLVLGFAVLFRVIGLGAEPILEDDAYRFLWDGRQTVEQGSPYRHAPAKYFADESLDGRWEDILGKINYPEVPTVYGPISQYSFALAYLIAPGEIWGLQLVYLMSDLLLIILLVQLTNSRNVLLYAWSPLVIKEFSYSAHPDVLGALFLLLGWWFVNQRKVKTAGVAIACALGVKIFVVIVVPFLLRSNWRAYMSFVATALIVALPFGVVEAWLPAGLAAMGQNWTFNAPIYLTLIDRAPLIYVKAVMGILLILFGFWLYFSTRWRLNEQKSVIQIQLMFAALFICVPAMNPWYLVWLLVFAAIKPTLWSWVASVVVLFAYISGINLEGDQYALYQQPLLLVWAEFALVMAAAILQVKLSAPHVSKRF